MEFLKNQNIPTKPCPRCGEGTVYVGERAKSLNLKIEGQVACENCVLTYMVNKHMESEDKPSAEGICLSCGNNIGAGEEHWELCPELTKE